MLKRYGLGFGFFFILLGILALIDYSLPQGIFKSIKVNLPLVELYFATGVLGFVLAFSKIAIRLYFQIVGFVYGVLVMMSFYFDKGLIFDTFANAPANTFIHTGVAIFASMIGFGTLTKAKEES